MTMNSVWYKFHSILITRIYGGYRTLVWMVVVYTWGYSMIKMRYIDGVPLWPTFARWMTRSNFVQHSPPVAVLEDIDLVGVVQTLVTKCMESDEICNEFYLQLIKQTTDTPPGESTEKLLVVFFECGLKDCSVVNKVFTLYSQYEWRATRYKK